MKTLNYKGFNVVAMTLEDFIKETEDREQLEVVKVEGLTFLYRPKTNQLYAVSEKGVKENELQ